MAPPKVPEPESSVLAGLKPDELFARGMQSVKMTGAGGLSDWKPPTVEEATLLFPNYEITDIIGRGGMGVVYKAHQLALDRIVAIKLLPLEVSVDRDFAERFKREAKTMARMNHPLIVSVFDFGTTTEGHLFFVMEFVEGTTLHHLIKTTGLKPPQALEIITGVCEALQYAHSEGVVHRDIKPANVLVDVKGRVKVTDFGLARFSASASEQAGYTMTGTVLGTPDYMAPEQKRGMHVDHRADIYSLGVMFYEMLCGQVPQGVFDLPSKLISVDERVDQVVIRAMQQEPNRRYQNTADMNSEVQTIRFAKDSRAKAPKPRLGGGDSKSKLLPIAAGIVGLGIVVGATLWFNRSNPVTTAPAVPLLPATPAATPDLPPAENAKPAVAATKPPEPEPTVVEKPAIAATSQPPSVAPKPLENGQPPTAPATALTPAPVATPEIVKPNPAMAAAVAQLGPNTAPPGAAPLPGVPGGGDSGAAPPIQQWERLADRADALVKQRDPDGAIEVFEAALEAAENSPIPAPPAEIARICYQMGALEAGIGSVASARGSLEHGKRLLLDERKAGKLDAVGLEVLGNIETTLRRLPRQ